MSRAVLVLHSAADKAKAILWADKAPWGTRVEFKGPRRSIPQNDRMWAMLTEIAAQVRWHGIKLSADDWKLMFLDALKREVRMVPNLDGNGFVNLGRSSSDLSKAEFSDLFDVIEAWCAANDVRLAFSSESGASAGGDPRPRTGETVRGPGSVSKSSTPTPVEEKETVNG